MCFFCCVSLRGTVYFMVTVHMIGMFGIFLKSVEIFLFPPEGGYPDVQLSPAIVSQAPLMVAGYSILSSLFACFIFRAVDMDSIMVLKWSGIGFGVYQFLVILMQLLFSVMFGDLLNKMGQGVLAGLLVINFFSTLVYLCVLFLYGKQLHEFKYGSPKLYRNSFGQGGEIILGAPENNWTVTQLPNYTKQMNIPNLNFLRNHPGVTRTNSVSTSTNTDNEELQDQISISSTV